MAVETGEDVTSPGPMAPGAPVLHMRGFGYRGSVETRSRPPER